MKQQKYLILAILLFITLWSFAQVSTVQFTENTGTITNPERGFYKHTTTHDATSGPLTGQQPYELLTQAQLTGYRNGGNTLILRLFYIHEFANADHIDQAYLNKMTADFQALRANGMKAFIRFAYSNSANSKDNGITLARIQNHLADVKPILEANKDVITAVQAGLVGAWGEWYYTNNFGDAGQINNQEWIKRYGVISALLQNVPSSIMVQLRSPSYKTRYLQHIGESSSALNESEAYNPSLAKARLGHHNDCFLSTPDNKFKTIKIPKSLLVNPAAAITVGYRVFPDTVAPLNQRQLPVPAQPMASYTMGANTVTGGVVNWDNTTNLVFPFGFMLALKVADDANNVYIHVGESGYTNASTYELYLNTDNNNTTGWIESTGKWTSSGADLLLKDGVLNTYPNTTWTPIAAPGMTITPSTTDAIDDVGTFLNTGEIAYQSTDSRFVAVGGESCIPNDQNGCTNSLARMAAHHYTYMNTDYRGEVIDKWIADGCYSEMSKRLGYRFRLTESRIQSSVNAGKALSVSIDINNSGFAAPYNKRSLELILTNTVTNQEFKIDLENNSSDVRFWLPGNHTINESVTIPANIPVGSYTLALNLPDASSSIGTDPRYSIQFANQGIWNAAKGYNNLNTTINVLTQTGSGTPNIIVDGNAADWQNVDNLSVGGGTVQTLKSYDDANSIYFIAQGTLGDGYTVFIDADGKSFTGYSGAAQGADYKIENGNLFRHEFGESWIQIMATLQVVHNGTVTEVLVPKTALYGLSETVKFSYNDLQGGAVQNTIPASGLHAYTLNFPVSVPRPAVNIVTDGNSVDWLYLAPASSNDGDLKILKIFDDATSLHLLVKGAIGTVSQLFFNTDNNTTTGLVDNTIWPDMGADYVILNNNLFKHDPTTGGGANTWAWTLVGAITSQIPVDNGTHEIAISKTLFTNPSLPANATIHVGYRKLINNVEAAKVPAVGGMASYILGGGSLPTAPSSPSNMSATTFSSTQINLSWTDNASNEDSFDIQRSPTGTNAWQIIATVNANATSYSNINIASGIQYFYRVRATNTIGISNWSNTASDTTPGTVPNAPSNLVATAFSSSQIDLSWTDNATNETNFEIQYSPTGTGNWLALTTVTENSTSYSNSGLSANTTRHYRIRTTNAIGNSSYTTVASATTPTGGGGGSIIVDGNSADWNGISTVAIANGQSMTSMRVTDSGTHLYFLIEGAALGPNTQLFLNTDNNTATGYQSATWTNGGMDYLLNNNALFKSTTNTTTWGWQEQTAAVVQYVKNASTIEISLLKTDINPNTTITVGVIDYNNAVPWGLISKLPAAGEMAIYTLTGANTSSPPIAPSAPVASAASTGQIALTWTDNAANESNFEIQQSLTGTNNWSNIVTVAANSTSHTITDLNATTTYHYRLRAINANGASTYTNSVSATTQTAGGGGSILVDGNGTDWGGINAVTIASGQSMTSMRVTDSGTHLYFLIEGAALGPNTQLFMNTDNNTATGYQSAIWSNAGMDYLLNNGVLFKSTTNTTVWGWQEQTSAVVQYVKNANTIEIGLLKTDINPNTSITVGVIDYNGATPWGLVSKLPAVGGMAVYALTGANGITIPNVPSALMASVISTSQIDLTWTDNATNETNFEIQQSATGTGNWSTIATVNENSTSYSNTGLTANTTYHYRIRTTNTAGASGYTNSTSATTQSASVSITVDGNASDWSGISAIATETGQTITSMKVTDNATHLFVLLQGSGISLHTQVFINADNNASTGHQHEDWTTSGADYMIEDNEQYTATSNTSGWDWQFDGDTGIEYAKNASVVEISILKTNINPNATITIAAQDLDDPNWDTVSLIPTGSSFITYTLGGSVGGPTIPNAPSVLAASAVSTSQIDLTWTDNTTDETNFEVQQSSTGTSNWSTIATLNENSISYSNTGLTANTTYHYRVRATNAAGASIYTDSTSATTAQAIPNAPSALTASATSTSQIDLNWTDNATDEDNFEVQQSLTGTGGWSTVVTVNENSTSYFDTGLNTNTTYHYRVSATNTAGSSSWSATTSATTQSAGGGSPTITVDGNASDWSTINTIATETGQAITSMKVADSPTHIYVLLEGSGISENTEVFINSDNDANTGYEHDDWTTSGQDDMIENDELYIATANSNDWNDWQHQGTTGIVYVKNSSVVEISILKSLLSPNSTITISAQDLDSNWDTVSSIPSSGAMLSYTLANTAKFTAKPYITGEYVLYPNPNQGNFDIKFGNTDVKSVTIYNMLGAKIFQKEYANPPKTDQFNLSKLQTGLYKVLITTNHTNIMKTLFITD